MPNKIFLYLSESIDSEPKPTTPYIAIHPGEIIKVVIDAKEQYELTFDDLANLATRKATIHTKP